MLRLLTFVVGIALIANITAFATERPYIDRVIVVRFVGGSPLERQWLAAQRTGSVEAFRTLLGTHQSQGFIGNATLKAVQRAASSRKPAENTLATVSEIASIATIHYEASIDPFLAAQKIAQHPDVAYAEPLFTRSIIAQPVDAPNDPLAKFQYYLTLVRAPEAWQLITTDTTVLVGVVDTGIDTTHEDLAQNVFRNPGETGLDLNGLDKRSNGIDDDNNGFVDDWYGWDFVGADGEARTEDNSPLPGNEHGTHVAGTIAAVVDNNIGTAGVAIGTQVLAVKVSEDRRDGRGVYRTSEAILYAAAMGCDVINCSFGSASFSQAERDAVALATSLGSLVVAAAGNDGDVRISYPAGHEQALSVTATNTADEHAPFANIHPTVDVAAPGVSILAPIPTTDQYDYLDGTSMATPVAAAVAALVKLSDPSLSPSDVHAIVKANTVPIDTADVSKRGLLGTGRVDALAAVRRQAATFAEITEVRWIDADGDDMAMANEVVDLELLVVNRLGPLANPSVSIERAPSDISPDLLVATVPLAPMNRGSEQWTPTRLSLQIPADAPMGAALSLFAVVRDGDVVISRQLLKKIVNPGYRTLRENDLTVSVTATGNIGYTDYPENTLGEGFRVGSAASWLFEGAFLVGSGPSNLPNNARRDYPSSTRDDDFYALKMIDVSPETSMTGVRAVSRFADYRNDANLNLGVTVQSDVIQPTSNDLQRTLFIRYLITNPSDTTIPAVHAALFFDWDISEAGAEDGIAWDNASGLAIAQHARRSDVPTIAVGMLSPLRTHFYAIDNPGSPGSFGIYDGFYDTEKWIAMSSGIGRANSSIADVSMVIGGGPFTLEPGQSREVAFFIDVADDLASARLHSPRVREAASQLGFDVKPYTPLALREALINLEGGQVQVPGVTNVRFELARSTSVTMTIADLQGQVLGDVLSISELPAGSYELPIAIPSATTGTYFLRMHTATQIHTMPIQILP